MIQGINFLPNEGETPEVSNDLGPALYLGKFGGCTRIRTSDPLIKSQLLYQLSYAPAGPVWPVETTIPLPFEQERRA